jgi:ATP-dependent Clp protease, protease subunit
MRMQNRSPFRPRIAAKTRIEAKSSDEATVYLYDEISWFGISAEQAVKELNSLTAKTIHIRFNSPGGSVFDGTAIYNAIKQHKSKTVAHIDGLAASIASVIALAADEVWMSDSAFLMIHDPWSIVIGNSETMREEAELLDKVGGVIAKTYMDKSGMSEAEIRQMMTSETWMTASEAKEKGFIDVIEIEDDDKKAKACFDLSVFANVPEKLKENKLMPTERDLERILRDAGCSSKQAKEILAKGYSGNLRDEVEVAPPPVEPQRDVEPTPLQEKSSVEALMTRAEMMAPSKN